MTQQRLPPPSPRLSRHEAVASSPPHSVAAPHSVDRTTVDEGNLTRSRPGELLLMACVAILLRAALFAIGTRVRGWSLEDFVNLRDGSSYIHLAQAFRGNHAVLTLFDRRVFPGYSALIALVSSVGVSAPVAGLTLAWLATAITPALTAKLYDDRRMGWAIVMLTPSYLMYTTLVMSEAVLLTFTVGGLVLFYRRRVVPGALLLGYAGLVRPMACFAVLGAAIEGFRRNRRAVVVACVGSALVVGLGLWLMQLWNGDALQNVRIYANDDKAYAGQLFALPFESLVMTPIRWHVPLWKVTYIWAYVVFTFVGCYIIVRDALAQTASEERRLARLNAPWLIGNTLFVLCVGHIWGFHEFHRFIVPALPPLLWAFRYYYPRRAWGWSAIGIFSFAMALFGLIRSA